MELKDSKGFTLMEVVIALSLLAFGLLAMASMQVMSIKTGSQSQEKSRLMTCAVQKMETLKNTSYAGIQSEASSTFPDYPEATGSVTVQDSTPGTNMKTVTVSAVSGNHTVTLTTIIAAP